MAITKCPDVPFEHEVGAKVVYYIGKRLGNSYGTILKVNRANILVQDEGYYSLMGKANRLILRAKVIGGENHQEYGIALAKYNKVLSELAADPCNISKYELTSSSTMP